MNLHIRRRGLLAALASSPSSAAELLIEVQSAFSDFKAKNSAQLSGLGKEVDEINAQLAAIRIGGGPGDGLDNSASAAAVREVRQAVAGYMRTGALPQDAMRVSSDPDGGYTVDRVLSDTINRRTFDVSPLGRLARRETISVGDSFEEPIDPSDIGAEWVGEDEDRPELNTSKLKMLSVPVHEVYTLQPVTQRLLDDSQFDIGGWLEAKISDKLARKEGAAFVAGDGVRKPRGLLSYQTSTEKDGVREWFTIQHVNTGAVGAFDSSAPGDALIDTVYSLRAPYRQNARWLMNLATAGVVRKFKDGQGNYLWQQGAVAGQPPSLLGYPVELDEEMPVIGANSLSIAFGDFRQAYLVVEKPGIRLLRDPYTAKPRVLFYAYRRIGGGLQNGEAVKLVRFGTA